MLKITYDISLLGLDHGRMAPKTGTVRAIKSLFFHLLDRTDIDLRLAAPLSYTALRLSLDLIRTTPRLAGKEIPLSLSNRLGVFLEPLTRFQAAPRLSNKFLSRTDIYHTQFLDMETIRKKKGLKKVFALYDLIPLIHPEYYTGLEYIVRLCRRSIAMIDRSMFFLCISESVRNDLLRFRKDLRPSQAKVIYLGASEHFSPFEDKEVTDKTREKYHVPKGVRYLLSLTTLEPRKNLDRLIRCFYKFVEENKAEDLVLVLAGAHGWDFSKIYEEADKNQKLRNKVIFMGYVPDADLPPLCSGALAFVYLSLYEGFGLPVLEAMQCGAPVIISNTSSLPEVAGNAGILVDPTDEEAIVDSFYRICKDENLRSDLSKKSIERARLFSWKKCAQETVDFYKKVVEG